MPNKSSTDKRTDPYYQAQAILSHRDQVEAEMRMKLARKGFAPVQIDQVLARLKQEKLIDDNHFAARYVENTLRFKRVGPRWLEAKLRQKKIPAQIVTNVLAMAYGEGVEEQLVRAAVTAWKHQHATLAHDRTRLFRFLVSRGFSSGSIIAVLGET